MSGLALALLGRTIVGTTVSSATVGGEWSMAKPLPYHEGGGVSVFLDPGVGGCGADCGKVLFTTGAPVGGYLFSYDPNNPNGGWTKLGAGPPFWVLAGIQLTGVRCVMAHACGKVLFIGAPTDSAGVATLYDPNTHTWADAGSVKNRGVFAATKLLDGRVLVTGGEVGNTNGDAQKVTETWDPVTNLWTDEGDLRQGRYDFAATLLDGPGCRATPAPGYCGQVLVAGGWKSKGGEAAPAEDFAREIETYDPDQGRWTSRAPLVSPRDSPTATPLRDGRVLIAGGMSPGGTLQSSAEIYEPALGISVPATPMTVVRDDATAVLLPSGKVLMIGGGPVASAEVYDPVTGVWTLTVPSPSTPRQNSPASLIPGQCGESTVVVAGGDNLSPTASSPGETSVELFTPRIPRIDRISPADGPVSGGQQVTISGAGLLGVLAVRFGEASGLVAPGGSDTEITVTTPPHGEGTVDVSASSLDGSPPPCQHYRYWRPPGPTGDPHPKRPSVRGIGPPCVPTSGGPITVDGTNLGSPNAVGVTVDGAPVRATVSLSGTQLVATAPGGVERPVSVAVTNGGVPFYAQQLQYSKSCGPVVPVTTPGTLESITRPVPPTDDPFTKTGLLTSNHTGVAAPPGGGGGAPGSAPVVNSVPVTVPGTGSTNLSVAGVPEQREEVQSAAQENHAMVRRTDPDASAIETAAGAASVVMGCMVVAVRRRRVLCPFPAPRRA